MDRRITRSFIDPKVRIGTNFTNSNPVVFFSLLNYKEVFRKINEVSSNLDILGLHIFLITSYILIEKNNNLVRIDGIRTDLNFRFFLIDEISTDLSNNENYRCSFYFSLHLYYFLKKKFSLFHIN